MGELLLSVLIVDDVVLRSLLAIEGCLLILSSTGYVLMEDLSFLLSSGDVCFPSESSMIEIERVLLFSRLLATWCRPFP